MADLLNNMLNSKTQTKPTAQPLPAIKIDLNSQNKIQPLNPKGRLLKSHIIGSPIEYLKDLKTDIVGIGKGVSGKANDHELGKMNDLAMKVGSLGLAAYLFSKSSFKLKKTMEFVGFGTFFASMALWPKIAIQAPLKARTGVDIHQKYEDSYGRKKMFFQDPQYIPWDLVSKEELNKMGDRLGVPKDIKNRDEVTKLKAQKIAVQGNTLWMLSAGIAAPVMSALSCNGIERGLLRLQQKLTLDKTESKMDELNGVFKEKTLDQTKLDNLSSKFKNKDAEKALKEYLKNNASQPLTAEAKKEIIDLLSKNHDIDMLSAIESDLFDRVKSAEKQIDDSFAKKIFDSNSKAFNLFGISLEDLQKSVKTVNDKIVTELEENVKQAEADYTKAVSENAAEDVIKNAKEIYDEAAKDLKRGFVIETDNSSKSSLDILKQLAKDKKDLNKGQIATLAKDFKLAFESAIQEHNAATIGDTRVIAEDLFTRFDNMFAQRKIMDKYIDARIGDKAETYIANQWGRVNTKILKALNFNHKELLSVGMHGELVEKADEQIINIIENKLTQLAKNPKKYEAAMEKITAAIAEYDKTLSDEGFINIIKEASDSIGNLHAKEFASKGYENIAKNLVGTNIENGLSNNRAAGAMKNAIQQNAKDRVLGARASFYRMIQTMDLYKKMESFKQIENADFSNFEVNELIKLFKGEDIGFGDRWQPLQNELKKAFNEEYTCGQAWGDLNNSLNKIVQNGKSNDGKINWIRQNIERLAEGKPIPKKGINTLEELIKSEMGDGLTDSTAKEIIRAANEYKPFHSQRMKWKTLASMIELSSDSSLLNQKMTKELTSKIVDNLFKSPIVEKSKKTLLSYTITDHTEKLNEVGHKTYKSVMNLLFNSKFDEATNKVIAKQEGLLNNIDEYKRTFIDKVANWDSWYKPAHKLDGYNDSFDGMKRHLLVAFNPKELISKAADNAYNTKTWMRIFGSAGAALLGVTLAAGLFFGKMKQDDVYAGGNK